MKQHTNVFHYQHIDLMDNQMGLLRICLFHCYPTGQAHSLERICCRCLEPIGLMGIRSGRYHNWLEYQFEYSLHHRFEASIWLCK